MSEHLHLLDGQLLRLTFDHFTITYSLIKEHDGGLRLSVVTTKCFDSMFSLLAAPGGVISSDCFSSRMGEWSTNLICFLDAYHPPFRSLSSCARAAAHDK